MNEMRSEKINGACFALRSTNADALNYITHALKTSQTCLLFLSAVYLDKHAMNQRKDLEGFKSFTATLQI